MANCVDTDETAHNGPLISIYTVCKSSVLICRAESVKLDRKALETIYSTFIRPMLEYGDVIRDNT